MVAIPVRDMSKTMRYTDTRPGMAEFTAKPATTAPTPLLPAIRAMMALSSHNYKMQPDL